MCPACFDAILFQLELEESLLECEKMLNEGLEFEKERLKKEGYFSKETIGRFYGVLGTRPYIRGLYKKAQILLDEGKVKLAKEVCLEILKLNENDNTGARYVLMAIYAYLEEEKELLKIVKKYPEEALEVLYPQFALYYKLGKNKEAKALLKRMNKANPYFIKVYNGTLKEEDMEYDGSYQKGRMSEVVMYFEEYTFLLMTMINASEFILKNSK